MTRLEVLYEDNHLLVVDKPVGIATMGVAAEELTMARLAANYLKQKYRKPGNVYVGVVSRLDRMVSGVLLLARTSKAASRLSNQFRQRSVAKRYLACVGGTVPGAAEAWYELNDHLLKSESRQRMEVVSPHHAGAQQATLRYRLLNHDRAHSLLEVELITGRKHQIRAQLTSLGHPIVGDRKYDSNIPFPAGIALHCHYLGVAHPTQQTPLHFRSLPTHWPAHIEKLLSGTRLD